MIRIIDAPCGAGKTTWAIQEMKANPDKRYIFCTPFLDEISRIRTSCGCSRFKEPLVGGRSKLEDFNALLAEGVCIAVTHSTFLHATEETLDLIRQGGYTLILDEAVDPVGEFNKIQQVEYDGAQQMRQGDIQMLLDHNLIAVGDDYKVKWTGSSYQNGKFSVFERMVREDRVYLLRETLLVCIYPPKVFSLFEEVTVLTYLFEGSVLKPYFRMFGIPFELASVEQVDGQYSVGAYNPLIDQRFRREAAALIDLCDSPRLNLVTETLSKKWYQVRKAKEGGLDELKRHLRHYLMKTVHVKASERMWTCPKDFRDDLTGRGYTMVRQMTREELALPPNEREKLEKKLSCFVPCNAKATNEFSDRSALAYCCNIFYNPIMLGLFQNNGIEFNEEMFALSCLVQWVWRSRIRNGQPISLYIPSKRMRDLFCDWLNVPEE